MKSAPGRTENQAQPLQLRYVIRDSYGFSVNGLSIQ
jgi:hypothetical protein